jgi:hypothetical protein
MWHVRGGRSANDACASTSDRVMMPGLLERPRRQSPRQYTRPGVGSVHRMHFRAQRALDAPSLAAVRSAATCPSPGAPGTVFGYPSCVYGFVMYLLVASVAAWGSSRDAKQRRARRLGEEEASGRQTAFNLSAREAAPCSCRFVRITRCSSGASEVLAEIPSMSPRPRRTPPLPGCGFSHRSGRDR